MYKDYEIKLNAILDKHGVQKVELKDLKTVKALVKEADSILDKFVEAKSDVPYYIEELEEYKKDLKDLAADIQEVSKKDGVETKYLRKIEKDLDKFTKEKEEVEKVLKAIAERLKTDKKKVDKTREKEIKSEKQAKDAIQKLQTSINKSKNLLSKLETARKEIIKNAKNLGVDITGQLGSLKVDSIIGMLKKATNHKVPKIK